MRPRGRSFDESEEDLKQLLWRTGAESQKGKREFQAALRGLMPEVMTALGPSTCRILLLPRMQRPTGSCRGVQAFRYHSGV